MLTILGPHRQYGLYMEGDCIASADHPDELLGYWALALNAEFGASILDAMAYVAIVDRHSGIDVTSFLGEP